MEFRPAIRGACFPSRAKRCVIAFGVVFVAANIATADTTVWNFTGSSFTPDVGPGTMGFFNSDATFGAFGSSSIGGNSTSVLNFGAATATQGLEVTHGASPNGGGSFVNQYTLMMDINFPSVGAWAGLYQTDVTNGGDGDWFMNPSNGIGISGVYEGTIVANTWHRIGLVVDSTSTGSSYRKYIDGVEVGVQNVADTIDGRFSLDPMFLLLTDNDNETLSGELSSVLFSDRPFSPAEMSARGGATASGIPDTVTLPVLEMVFNRDGNIRMENNTGFAQSIKGYSILSGDGALIEANADFFADTNNNWVQFTAPGATGDLSEGHLTTASIANGASIPLGDAWLQYYKETADISFEYLDGNGDLVQGNVRFEGGVSDLPYPFLDLNLDGVFNASDWPVYVADLGSSNTSLSPAQAYRTISDLNGDGVNNYIDFLIFEAQYDAQFGDGAFDNMLAGVPEPSSMLLMAILGAIAIGVRKYHRIGAIAIAVASFSVYCASEADAQIPSPVGLWDFNNAGNLTNAAIGNDLILVGSQSATAGIGGGDGAVSMGIGSYYQAAHGIAANGAPGADFVNDYTLIFDVKYPASSAGQWRSFFNTDNTNTNDGDYFIHPSDESWGVGALGYTDNPGIGEFFSSPDTWYRVVMAAHHSDNPGEAYFNMYINGVLTGQHNPGAMGIDGRFSLYSSADAAPYILLAADNDGEDAEMHYSNIGIWDRPLNPLEITALGGPDANGIDLNAAVAGLTLEVNKTNGNVKLLNSSGVDLPEEINFYEIISPDGALDKNGWDSLDSQNYDADGPGIGQSWDEGGGSSDSLLTEAFLAGGSSFLTSTPAVDLGNAFDENHFGVGNDGDLEFWVVLRDSKLRIQGRVEYITGSFLEADFDEDGDVDGDDFLAWQGGFGTTSGADKSDGDYDNDGDVDGDDFLGWQSEFGSGAGSGAVPEPSTLALFGLIAAALGVRFGSKKKWSFNMPRTQRFLAIFGAVVVSASAMASSTVDRDYRLGDDDPGAGHNGSVGTSIDNMFLFSGSGGDQQNLSAASGNENYVNVGPSGLGRPGAASGDLGIQFVAGDQDYLTGDRLGLPSTSVASGNQGGILDYGNISNRGFQLWVRPAAAGGAAGLQDIVMDTDQHGARISAAGTWVMRYDGSNIDSGVSVTPGQWYHVMVVRPFGSTGISGGSRMYVNGVAVAAEAGGYDGSDDSPLVLGANTGDGVSTFPGTANFFSGVMDDLELFVMGEGEFGTDFGTFNAAEDNDFINAQLSGIDPADVNLDTVVNSDDVDDFVDNWLRQQTVSGLLTGDLVSRGFGDLNYDGIVNLSDWSILNAANPGMGAAVFAALGRVPEPSTIALLAIGLVGIVVARRHRIR